MSIEKVYKVIRESQGNYFSARVRKFSKGLIVDLKEYRLQYYVGSFILPKISGSRIFCFASYKAAAKWAYRLHKPDDEQIFLAEALGVEPIYSSAAFHQDIELYWKALQAGNLDKCHFRIDTLPVDSLGVGALKLLKRLD